jgi:hypothetical protein
LFSNLLKKQKEKNIGRLVRIEGKLKGAKYRDPS